MVKTETKIENKKDVAIVKKEKNDIVSSVLARVNELMQFGELKIPENYEVANALRSAFFLISNQKDNDKKPVLESCAKDSVANALFEMVVEGLSPLKHQCSFIPYAGKLTYTREWAGAIALAKRFDPSVVDVIPNCIFEGDEFGYEIDTKTGLKKIIKHIQELKNIDNNKIIGAYCHVIRKDKEPIVDIMTMPQIRQSWLQGFAKGNSPAHKNFTIKMAEKTIIHRVCTPIFRSSDDENVYKDNEYDLLNRGELKEQANQTEMGFTETEVIKEEVKEKPVDTKTEIKETGKEPDTNQAKEQQGKLFNGKTEVKPPEPKETARKDGLLSEDQNKAQGEITNLPGF